MSSGATGRFSYNHRTQDQDEKKSSPCTPNAHSKSSHTKAIADNLFSPKPNPQRRQGNTLFSEIGNQGNVVNGDTKIGSAVPKVQKVSVQSSDQISLGAVNVKSNVSSKEKCCMKTPALNYRKREAPVGEVEKAKGNNDRKKKRPLDQVVDKDVGQYKYGKILVGDNDTITAKEAEDELMSLLPKNVKMGVFLAEGGFGKVFMVSRTDTNESLVCKACMHYGKEREFKLFVTEGRMQRLFDHKNICRAYSYGYGPNMAVTFLEFLNGAELFDLIPHKVGISLTKAFDYFRQILDGLEYLHGIGFAHLDIKPENIIVTNEGVAKLVDFGHGVMYRYKEKYRPITGRRGTRPYMAPETVNPNVPYDPLKVDIFSFGITLLTVVTGERIWKEPRSRDKVYDAWCNKRTDEVRQFRRLPPDLLSFLRGMLEPDPKKRKGFAEIRQHIWFRTGLNGGLLQEPLRSADAMLADRHMSSSQPAMFASESVSDVAAPVSALSYGGISYSQPVGGGRTALGRCHLADERPERGFNPRCIMRRLTRFFSKLDATDTLEKLRQAVAGQVHVKMVVRGAGDLMIEARTQVDPFTARVVLILFPSRRTKRNGGREGPDSAQNPGDVLVEFRRASGDEFAFLEMYHSIYRTMTRMKVVDEDHPYLEILNSSTEKANVQVTSYTKCNEDGKEKTT